MARCMDETCFTCMHFLKSIIIIHGESRIMQAMQSAHLVLIIQMIQITPFPSVLANHRREGVYLIHVHIIIFTSKAKGAYVIPGEILFSNSNHSKHKIIISHNFQKYTCNCISILTSICIDCVNFHNLISSIGFTKCLHGSTYIHYTIHNIARIVV